MERPTFRVMDQRYTNYFRGFCIGFLDAHASFTVKRMAQEDWELPYHSRLFTEGFIDPDIADHTMRGVHAAYLLGFGYLSGRYGLDKSLLLASFPIVTNGISFIYERFRLVYKIHQEEKRLEASRQLNKHPTLENRIKDTN